MTLQIYIPFNVDSLDPDAAKAYGERWLAINNIEGNITQAGNTIIAEVNRQQIRELCKAHIQETVAASLLHLDAEVLCFATNLDVSWQGYRYLFAHLAQLAQVTAQTELDWRERFKMVSARATPGNTASFVGNSYALWSETLYEESSEPGDAFSYDERDDSAPHYPLVIPRSDTFESFTPYSDIVEMQDMQISGVFGSFFRGLDERLEMIKHG